MIRIKTDRAEFEEAKRQIPGLLRELRQKTTTDIVARIDEVIRERVVPDGSGWVEWYLNNMRWIKVGDGVDLQVEEDVDIMQVPRRRSLVWVYSQPSFLAQMSPWTIRRIPRLKGGWKGNAIIRPVSAKEYDQHERKLAGRFDDITKFLREGQFEQQPSIQFQGGVKVDVEFLIKRIELGLGGLKRQRHMVFVSRLLQELQRGF